MSVKASPGMFITFEGGEGGGKSTQIRMLKERLEKNKHRVVMTREPGGTPEAEKVRRLLVDRAGGDWSPEAECLLLFAARAMHVRDLIAPSLAEGKTVLSDRFTDSTRAYQGYAGGMDHKVIEQIKQLSIGDLEPDMTFILDLPSDVGLARSNRRHEKGGTTETRFEDKELAFHEALRQGFLDIAKGDPQRCIVIDATKSINDVADEIWSHLT